MPPKKEPSMTKDEIHESLSNTSVELHYVFWNVPREQQIYRHSPDTLCALEILVQLRQMGDVYASRVKRICTAEGPEDIPKLHAFDEAKQLERINLEDETVKHNLGRFMRARSELLNTISFLEADQWDKLKCIHEELGEISLRELLIPLVRQELESLDQLKGLLGT